MSKRWVFPNLGFASAIKSHVSFGQLPDLLRYAILLEAEFFDRNVVPKYPRFMHDTHRRTIDYKAHDSVLAVCTNDLGGVELYECGNNALIELVQKELVYRDWVSVRWFSIHAKEFDDCVKAALQPYRKKGKSGKGV